MVNKRIALLDNIRGANMISMILFHIINGLVYYCNINIPLISTSFLDTWGLIIRTTFIFLSGLCINLSRKNYKNGIRVLFCGFIITLTTNIIIPEYSITFGILSFMGSAIILSTLLYPIINKIPAKIGLVINIILFILFFNFQYQYIGLFKLPDELYQFKMLYPIGLMSADFHSEDYFPIIPWIFLFLSGFFFGKFKDIAAYKNSENKLISTNIKIFSFIGRHSLMVYMFHAPIIYAMCALILHYS